MAEKKTPRFGAAPAVALALAAVALALSGWNYLERQKADSELTELREALEDQRAALRFADREAFDKAVVSNIDNYIHAKQSEEVERKYVRYSAAPEETKDGKWFYGNLDARFTLVEFSDLECPYCKRFHETPKKIVDSSNGNVNWQWKHLPLDFHNPVAYDEAHGAECVAEQKGNRGFWVFVDEVFKHTKTNGGGVGSISALAAGVGVDAAQFQDCMDADRYREKINADVQMASNNGINGTPATFVVDNQTGRSQLVSGAQPPEAILGVIRKMVAEAQAPNGAE